MGEQKASTAAQLVRTEKELEEFEAQKTTTAAQLGRTEKELEKGSKDAQLARKEKELENTKSEFEEGCGRIGHQVARFILDREDCALKHINSPTSPEDKKHLME